MLLRTRLGLLVCPLLLLAACGDGSDMPPAFPAGDASTQQPTGLADGGAPSATDGAASPTPTPTPTPGPIPTQTGDGGVLGDASAPGTDATVSNPGGGSCCSDGNCLCHGTPPSTLSAEPGPYKTASFTLAGAGCVTYPTDVDGPIAAVAVSDGFGGSGGCGFSQTGDWGPLYASWGIATMIIATGGGDQPQTRGDKLTAGIAAFKKANEDSQSPLFGKLSGRYGTSGFSMGGGGTSFSSQDDATLKTSVAIMPWGPTTTNIQVPTLVICGSSDTIAPCGSHGNRLYAGIADSVPKMRVQVSSGHAGQPSAGRNMSGAYGLAFQKVFLEGDTRWRPLLVGADSEETNIQ